MEIHPDSSKKFSSDSIEGIGGDWSPRSYLIDRRGGIIRCSAEDRFGRLRYLSPAIYNRASFGLRDEDGAIELSRAILDDWSAWRKNPGAAFDFAVRNYGKFWMAFIHPLEIAEACAISLPESLISFFVNAGSVRPWHARSSAWPPGSSRTAGEVIAIHKT